MSVLASALFMILAAAVAPPNAATAVAAPNAEVAVTLPDAAVAVTSPDGAAAGVVAGGVNGPQRQQAQGQQGQKQEPVDINTATAEQLQKVPGIGEALAARIISFREENGQFEKVDDLLNVRGIGLTSLEKLRPYLAVKKGS